MRDIIITYLKANVETGFGVSDHLPFNQNGEPLYLQNLKSLYVDQPTVEQEPLLETLDAQGIVSETTIAQCYVVTDAKTLPSNYDAQVTAVKGVRTTATILAGGYTGKEVDVSTSLVDDTIVTQFTMEFTRVK
jgi:hypothetical protein